MEDLNIRSICQNNGKITSNVVVPTSKFEECLNSNLSTNLEFIHDHFIFGEDTDEDSRFFNLLVRGDENIEVLNSIKKWANKVEINGKKLNVTYIDATNPNCTKEKFGNFPSIVVFGNLENKLGSDNAVSLISLLHDLYDDRFEEKNAYYGYDNVLFFIGIGGTPKSINYKPLYYADNSRFSSFFHYPLNEEK